MHNLIPYIKQFAQHFLYNIFYLKDISLYLNKTLYSIDPSGLNFTNIMRIIIGTCKIIIEARHLFVPFLVFYLSSSKSMVLVLN